MWQKLSKYSNGLTSEDDWVYVFLNMVDKFRKLPKHFYMSNVERSEAINEIKKATKELARIYTGLNNATFVEALQTTAAQTIQELKVTRLRGKVGKNVEAILFARLLANHNLEMFGYALRSVVKTAVLAIYGVDYADSDIYNHLNGRKPFKQKNPVLRTVID